jgi:hypothetical protein
MFGGFDFMNGMGGMGGGGSRDTKLYDLLRVKPTATENEIKAVRFTFLSLSLIRYFSNTRNSLVSFTQTRIQPMEKRCVCVLNVLSFYFV